MMELKAEAANYYEVETDVLAVPVFESAKSEAAIPPGSALKDLDQRAGGVLAEIIGTDEMRGRAADLAFIHHPQGLKARRLLLVGAGKRSNWGPESMSRFGGTAARFVRGKGLSTLGLLCGTDADPERTAQSIAEGVILGLLDPDQYKTAEKEQRSLSQVTLIPEQYTAAAAFERGVARGRIVAESVNMARSLSNEPSSTLTPTELAERAERVAHEAGMDIDVLDESRMRDLGMGALLGVSKGSEEPAKLIVLTYRPKQGSVSDKGPIAIVGKGITFDSGGISIKPADGMEKMKYDMSGAAATLAAMRAIAQLEPAVEVLGLMPTSENMPSGSAYKPGDVLRSMSGKTIEVVNTDAEGRLVLSDAISYARKLGATRIIDLATLTGAVSVALGTVNVGILGNDQAFVDEVRQAASEVGERLWQLPMDPEYRDLIKSDIADIKNSGGRYAGTITAAYFLREFAGDTPWVHLDIAGTAWENDRKSYISNGPTGVGVKTLINYVCNHAGRA